jgi:hypothetical protein
MKRRLPLKDGDEYDIMRGWRRWYRWTQRAGACKQVKRRINRRERRDGKAEACGPW